MKKPAILLIVMSILIMASLSFTIYDYLCIQLPATPYNYAAIPFPSDVVNNLSEMDNMPASNVTTDAGSTLGRVLFYDVDLSKNHTVSCSSCHIQEFSFTDTARFSVGFNGGLTPRNSMGLIHARFEKDSAFFWDNRAATLEIQTLMPIQNSVEMGLSLDTLVARVSAKSFYPGLFQSAFGTPDVTSDRISKALAQFIRSMNTFGSKYRQGVEISTGNPSIVPFPNFTAEENLGKDLFMDINRGNCQACHTRNIMVQQGSKNIGLDLVYADNGVGAATGNPSKNGQFSVPSLINVELTAPYMHDGRFQTLEQVIDFYSDSIKEHPNLDGFLREIIPGNPNPNNNPCNTCPPRRPHYSAQEKAALVAFLKTLTDTVITTDPRWSNPFCRSSILPVIFAEPMSAIPTENGVEVNWTTVTEINSDRFEVERSADAVHFNKITSVKGQGNSSLRHRYTILDPMPVMGMNYYRIKEVDIDGKFMYSRILRASVDKMQISISPNPAHDLIRISTNGKISRAILYNQQGSKVRDIQGNVNAIQVLGLPAGYYYLTLTDTSNRLFTRSVMIR